MKPRERLNHEEDRDRHHVLRVRAGDGACSLWKPFVDYSQLGRIKLRCGILGRVELRRGVLGRVELIFDQRVFPNRRTRTRRSADHDGGFWPGQRP